MKDSPLFLTLEVVLLFHEEEVRRSGGAPGLRDRGALESAIAAPQATSGGEYLMGIFEMAATYVQSLSMNHPFVDGNKRTAALAALAFLYYNGYECDEQHDEEVADQILGLVTKRVTKAGLATYFESHCRRID